jgi:hypothetical protein
MRRIAAIVFCTLLIAVPSIALGQQIALTLGLANLSGDDVSLLMSEDNAVLSPLFKRTIAPEVRRIPGADVLFLYAHLGVDGTIRGTKSGVREVAQLTKAAIVIVASPNTGENIKAAAGLQGPKSANLVFTLDRKGTAFPIFFRSLFERMRQGESMLSAWVELAPQSPAASQADLPETILLPERGNLAFPK